MCEIAYLATDFKIGSQLHDGQWRPTHLKIGRISYLVATYTRIIYMYASRRTCIFRVRTTVLSTLLVVGVLQWILTKTVQAIAESSAC